MPITNKVARVVAMGGLEPSEQWVNVFHLSRDAGWDLASAGVAAAKLGTFYGAEIQDECTTKWNVGMFSVTPLGSGTGGLRPSAAGWEFGVDIVGTNAAEPLPYEDALVISWGTAAAGRSGRGRTYLAGFASSSLDNDGRLLAVNQAAIADDCKDLVDGLNTDGNPLGVLSQKLAQWNEVTSIRLGAKFDRQVRRQKHINESFATRTPA